MDGKARLGVRNWDFSGQQPPSRGVDPSLKQPSPDGGAPSHQQAAAAAVSAQHAAFLKMSAYPESNYPGMDFGWVPQRNFLAAAAPPKSDLNSAPPPAPPPMPPAAAAAAAAKPAKKTKKSSRVATKILHPKAPKKPPPPRREKKGASGVSAGKREKKNTQEMSAAVEGISFDFSGVPAPVCSCTGVSRQCYRWGAAGWQSACCTTTISEYPLPMSSSRPGARLAGRKMSINAYSKLLQRLAVEGYDLSNPVDLKAHWARHGTNKFVTIR